MDRYSRSKSADEIEAVTHAATLIQGTYGIRLTFSPNNDEAVLRHAFGDEYKDVIAEPVDVETFPVYRLKYRNIIKMPFPLFGTPSFDGRTLKVWAALAPDVTIDLDGQAVSDSTITGTFKSRLSSLHGTFTLEKLRDLE